MKETPLTKRISKHVEKLEELGMDDIVFDIELILGDAFEFWNEKKRLSAEATNKSNKIDKLRKFIDLQAKDEGLWFVAETAPEAVVQRGLRGCHAMFEQLFPISPEHKHRG